MLEFITNYPDSGTRAIMEYLDQLILQNPGTSSKLRFKIPFYYRYSWVCYMNPLKSGGLELCFLRGQELSNEQGILDAKDRKMVAGITLKPDEKVPETSIREIIQEALLLDEMANFSSKKGPKRNK
jgi:hypothetical protein